jgi:hypothetical protein
MCFPLLLLRSAWASERSSSHALCRRDGPRFPSNTGRLPGCGRTAEGSGRPLPAAGCAPPSYRSDAPDELDRYFYFDSVPTADYLFRAVVPHILGEDPARLDKREQLAALRDQGHRLLRDEPRPPGKRIRELLEEHGSDGGKTIRTTTCARWPPFLPGRAPSSEDRQPRRIDEPLHGGTGRIRL